MPRPSDPQPPPSDLLRDPLLGSAPTHEGFKVLEPAVLYAKVGQGGMGTVYRGRHFKLELDVAVKCLKPSLVLDDPGYVKRFEREARLAASITHQNVVRVMDVYEKHGLHYLVMEFVQGETARERVHRKGALKEQEALAILFGATAGLAEAHARSIVHRDIKPDNILIGLDGRVKLADLGLAKATRAADGMSLSMNPSGIMGTPQYMAPEQWNTPDVGPPADVWALGATLYFLLSGRSAIDGKLSMLEIGRCIQDRDFPSLRGQRQDVRAAVFAVLEKCVRRLPHERYADARELLRALKPLVGDDDEVLVDAETGTGSPRVAKVTPPPRDALLKIRAVIGSEPELTVKPKRDAREPRRAREPERPGSAKTRRPASSPQRARRLAVGGAALGVLALVAVGATKFGLFGERDPALPGKTVDASANDKGAKPPVEDSPKPVAGGDTTPPAESRKDAAALPTVLLAEGNRLLREPDTLDEGVAKLEQCLAAAPQTAGLAAALSRGYAAQIAREREAKRAAEAWQIAQRWCTNAASSDATGVRSELEAELRNVLRAGAKVSVQDGAIVGRTLPVKITVTDPVIDQVRINDLEAPITSRAASATLTWADDGAQSIAVELQHAVGVVETVKVNVVADTAAPVVTWDSPSDGAALEPPIRLAGKVADLTVTTLTLNGRPIAITDGAFAMDLALADGRQSLALVATDAANLATRVERTITVVDTTPPTLTFDPPLPAEMRGPTDLRGKVSEPATVTVGGQTVAVGADLAFTIAFTPDATGKLVATAKDRAGNEARPITHTYRLVRTALPSDWACEVLDESLGAGGRYPKRVKDTKSGIVFVLIEAGQFEMGSENGEEDEKPVHTVRITKPFYLAETETTVAQWKRFVAATNHKTDAENGDGGWSLIADGKAERMRDATWRNPFPKLQYTQREDHPVVQVSWNDAQAFLRWLNGGREGAFKLPTEAQWEFAARAGTTGDYWWPGDASGARDKANIADAKAKQMFRSWVWAVDHDDGFALLAPAGSFKPNPNGLRDILGNVWEWCADAYDAKAYGKGGVDVADPFFDAGSSRVLRGGSFDSGPIFSRCAYRGDNVPGDSFFFVGFRAARTL